MEQVSNSAFSIRRLNPFNGVLQIYQLDSARALSANGQVWEIQVLSDTPQGLWANMPYSGRQYYTFGLWSSDQGLKQVPVNPLFNIRQMITSAERLVEQLQPATEHLPFPLADPYELWLLDEEEHQPIALLACCRNQDECDQDIRVNWIAASPGDFSFVSVTLNQQGLPLNDGYNPRVHASVLEAAVRMRAGQHRLNRWFKREVDGSATPCDDPAEYWRAACFPELLLTEEWEEHQERNLIQDYISWKAPQLLMLPNLANKTREHLERIAINQAEAVDRLWRLYPEIHNHDLLKSARVEAKIRTANRD
ncbi:MAG: hypothetical protein KZQ93_11910 [Candidatus Thiodiazotropha sp. (ex Monitilora ramsayi)]|nr:hypothetical protein [Candidatus Thiodiazotropha sp. (ex Monitilora ramsayi)]